MAKFRSAKTSFLGGEISPTAFGRIDLALYSQACKTMLNWIPLPSGGAYRRPGTFYEANGGQEGVSVYAPALIPFIYSQDEFYAVGINKLIGGAGFFNFYRPVSNTGTNTSSNLLASHFYDRATVGGGLGAYDEWHSVQYAQSADRLYLVHPNHPPLFLNRLSTDNFSANEYDSGLSGTALRDGIPFLEENTTATTLTVSNGAVGTGRTLTASATIFFAEHVGARFKIMNGAAIGLVTITAVPAGPYPVNNCTVRVDVEVDGAAAPTAATASWWESAWSDYQGWPRTVCFYQDRLCFGGTTRRPDSVWFSQTSNYSVFSVSTITDPRSAPTGSQPFTIQLLSTQVNAIQWMSPEKTLAVGTTGDEWLLSSQDGTSFGADNSKAEVQSHFGSSYNMAVRIGNELIFCTKDEETLRSFVFNFQEDSFTSDPIQILYDEYPKPDNSLLAPGNRKIRKFSWDKSRDTLWVLDTMGNFFGLTRDRRIPYSAWHRHRFAGWDEDEIGTALGSGSTLTSDPNYTAHSGAVMSFEVVPNPITAQSDVWVVVKRKTNGSFFYDIERIIGKGTPYDTAYGIVQNGIGQYFADASAWFYNNVTYTSDGLTYGSAGALNHLVGKSVVGTAFNAFGTFSFVGSAVDGSNQTVIQSPHPTGITDGTPSAAPTYLTSVTIGLQFDAILEPLRIEAGSQIGVSQGAIKRIHEVTLRLYRTLALQVGRDADNIETLIFRTPDLNMGQSAEFFTGDKRLKLDSDYDRDALMYILADKPLPATIISLFMTGMTAD